MDQSISRGNVTSWVIVFPSINFAIGNALSLSGIVTETVTSFVVGKITSGVTETTAFCKAMISINSLAWSIQPWAVAPGRIPLRAPSIAAFSQMFRTMFARENSIAEKTNSSNSGTTKANSTAAAPRCLWMIFRFMWMLVSNLSGTPQWLIQPVLKWSLRRVWRLLEDH